MDLVTDQDNEAILDECWEMWEAYRYRNRLLLGRWLINQDRRARGKAPFPFPFFPRRDT